MIIDEYVSTPCTYACTLSHHNPQCSMAYNYKCMSMMFMFCKTGQRRDSKMAPGPALHEILLLTSTHLDLRPARTYLAQADT